MVCGQWKTKGFDPLPSPREEPCQQITYLRIAEADRIPSMFLAQEAQGSLMQQQDGISRHPPTRKLSEPFHDQI
jgi:hypothetical protein